MRGPNASMYARASPPPSHAGVQVQSHRVLFTQFVEQFAGGLDAVGDDAVRLQQQLDAQRLGPLDRPVELLADAEDALVVRQVVAEVGLGIAFGAPDRSPGDGRGGWP